MSFTAIPFFWIFLGFYLFHEAVVLSLDFLNYRHTRRQTHVPEFFRGRITEETFQKAKSYSLDKIRFGIMSHILHVPLFWALIVFGGFRLFDRWASGIAGSGTLSHSVLFTAFVGLYFALAGLPFRAYSTFVIEERYGFNKTTLKTFAVDIVKGFLVAALLGAPVLYLVYWLMRVTGEFWWVWSWGSLTAFQLFVAAVFPTFLAPLFNKFTPLKDQTLESRIRELARKINFKLSGVFTVDGSRRSGHSNAYFAGMGRFRRIVLFDTLLQQLTPDELVAVLAHEMGHNVRKHIVKSMILSSLISLAGFAVLAKLKGWEDFYAAFNAPVSDHAAFMIFALASEAFTFVLTPLFNMLSRKNEYEADRFSAEVTGDKNAMKEALFKLTEENLSNLTPHPAYSFYHYSHPTTPERVAAIDRA